jgi:hypothetical protein
VLARGVIEEFERPYGRCQTPRTAGGHPKRDDYRRYSMDTTATTADPETYTAPVLSELGSVTSATLGSAGNNNADDTQYWQ